MTPILRGLFVAMVRLARRGRRAVGRRGTRVGAHSEASSQGAATWEMLLEVYIGYKTDWHVSRFLAWQFSCYKSGVCGKWAGKFGS